MKTRVWSVKVYNSPYTSRCVDVWVECGCPDVLSSTFNNCLVRVFVLSRSVLNVCELRIYLFNLLFCIQFGDCVLLAVNDYTTQSTF